MPFLGVGLVVVLDQHPEEDDEDDLQEEAGDGQLQPHAARRVGHGFFSVGPGGLRCSSREPQSRCEAGGELCPTAPPPGSHLPDPPPSQSSQVVAPPTCSLQIRVSESGGDD